jgi:hypothetical protein
VTPRRAAAARTRAAIRLRFGFSPAVSRVRIFPSFAAAARSAPGRITMPLLILSFRVSQACDLLRPVVGSVADGTPAAWLRVFQPP